MFRKGYLRLKHFQGAGILFCVGDVATGTIRVLLSRRKSGTWSIPGGKREAGDSDALANARRETIEEFGEIPGEPRMMLQANYPLGIPGLVGFHWTTFVMQLPRIPDLDKFPRRTGTHFRNEFTEAGWFNIDGSGPDALPPRTHALLHLPLFQLRRRRAEILGND